MKTYRIEGWDELYENNRTREMKNMQWIPLPNRHDGDGYTTLVDRKNGAALFGAWVAILQVASRCGMRGTLLRDGGDSHDAVSLSRMTRLPKEIIEEALKVCECECKWLTVNDSHEGAEIPHEGAEIPHPTDEEENRRKGREGNTRKDVGKHCISNGQAMLEAFEEFWKAYPNRVGKGNAETAWKKHGCDKLLPQILVAVRACKASEAWTKDGGQFIPHPTTWLNRRGWEDELLPRRNGSQGINETAAIMARIKIISSDDDE